MGLLDGLKNEKNSLLINKMKYMKSFVLHAVKFIVEKITYWVIILNSTSYVVLFKTIEIKN